MKKPSNGKDVKNKGACPRGKRKLEYNEKKQPKLPLAGKLIYLDIKDIRLAKKLEADLKRLGSSVEKFFVKEINYLITSHPRPKQKNEDKLQSADSPAGVSTPSPFNCGPSPSPGAVETKAPQSVTRGKAILQKAQLQKKTSTIIENAEKWQVKIVSVEAALKWIVKELAKLPPEDSKSNQPSNTRGSKIKRLRSPMLKFESETRQYRPVHASLGNWPFANVDTPKGTCPFDGTTVGRGERSREERGDRIGLALPLDNNMPASPAGMGGEDLNSGSNKTPKAEPQGKSRNSETQGGGLSGMKIVTAGDLKRRKEQKRIQERKRGYCECCQIKYDDLDKHVFQDQHKSFIREKKNYETLDHLIRTGPSTARFLQRVLLRHCAKQRTTDTNKSESDEEILLITPGKSAAKAAAKSKQQSLQPKSPRKGRQPAVVIESSIQGSKQLREKRKNSRDSKPVTNVSDSQPYSVSKTNDTKTFEDHSGKVDGNKAQSKICQCTEETSVVGNEEKKECESKDSKSKNFSPKVSFNSTKDLETLKSGLDKNVDHSPEKRSCTSDSLDIKNHVVPVRTRNCLGVYPNMSPSRVSWAGHQSLSADEDSNSVSIKPDKPSCVRVLDSPCVGRENIHRKNEAQDNETSKETIDKQTDCEIKGSVTLPGDRIKVLRESRSRSKLSQQCSQTEKSSLRKEKKVHEDLEDTEHKLDEVDGDSTSMINAKKPHGLVESPVISLSPRTRSNMKSQDVHFSPRKSRACKPILKSAEGVESMNNSANSQNQLDPSQVLDSISSKTKTESPVKNTKCQKGEKFESDVREVLDTSTVRTRSQSPTKNTKCQGKVEPVSSQVSDSNATRTRSQSPLKNTNYRDRAKTDTSEIKDSAAAKTRKQSPVKARNINPDSRIKTDSTGNGISTESNIAKISDKRHTGQPPEETSVELLKSPRTCIKRVINPTDENDGNGSAEKQVRSLSSKRRSVKYQNEEDVSVDIESASPRKRLRSRESHPIKDSQPAPQKSGGTPNVYDSPALRNPREKLKETNSEMVVPKKDTYTVAEGKVKCKNAENVDRKQHKLQSSKAQKENSKEDTTTADNNPITSSATETFEEGFYVNCMEMVKKRSQMRQEAQKNRSNSLDCPLSSSSVSSRLDGTPRRKKITVTVSPIKSNKLHPSESHPRKVIKSMGNTISISSPGVQREDSFNVKVHSKISNNTLSTKSSCRSEKRKSDVSSKTTTSGQTSNGSDNQSFRKDHISTDPHEGKRRCRPLNNDRKKTSSTGKSLSPIRHRNHDNFERSPSPLFNRSPKFNKGRQTHDKHIKKSSGTKIKRSVIYDPYDIRNLSPLKPGQNVLSSPRSGYSGETSRSKKKNRHWRPSQKYSSEGKLSSKKKLQKLKLPDPGTSNSVENLQSDIPDSDSRCEKNPNKGRTTREVSRERDQHSSKRRHSVRQKLELGGNISGGEEESSVLSVNDGSIDTPNRQADNEFIAIKKLEISDLTIIEHDEQISKKEKQSGSWKHNKKVTSNSAKHRKRKTSQSDSGVGSYKEKNDMEHLKGNSGSSLKWQTASIQMSPKGKTVKLNKSWTLLSDRSMAKILQSDGDDMPFEGFQPEHTTGGSLLGSEMSYVETTEVKLEENSDHVWELDHDEGVEEEGDDYIDYVNCTFTSPGKRTDSSWDETFDNYIDNQLNRTMPGEAKLNRSFNIATVHSSPRKFGSPRQIRHQQRGLTPNKRKAEFSDLPPEVIGLNITPKRRKFGLGKRNDADAGVERVDEDIEFNYRSPQKLKEVLSPRNKIGTDIVLSSSPVTCRGGLFTSTPHTERQNKKVSTRCKSLNLPALSDSVSQTSIESDNKTKTKSGHHRNKSAKTSSSQESVGMENSEQPHRSHKHRHKSHSKH